VVNEISNSLLGKFGAILAILGVVAAPITSGDTAFRSARLTVGDLLRFNQKPIRNRLIITIPLFAVGFLLTKINFDVVWRYFAWSNQTLATVVLWTITVYLFRKRKPYWITLLPALFMTAVVTTYIMLAPEGLALSKPVSYATGFAVTAVSFLMFLFYTKNYIKRG
jgi:carbon starvation protein CstA